MKIFGAIWKNCAIIGVLINIETIPDRRSLKICRVREK